jgi:predicted  nucleic acid-binding Zn-ribbon protein
MKHTKQGFLIILLMSMFSLTCIAQTNKKSEKARKDVNKAQDNLREAKSDLREANLDSTKDYIEFKKEAQQQIAENNEHIVRLREKKWNGDENNQEKYDRQVNALHEKNTELQHKIDYAHATSPSMWNDFKKEFSHDIGELRDAIKSIGTNDVK